jgi:hypothetical protein
MWGARALFGWLSDPEYGVRRSCRGFVRAACGNVAVVPAGPVPAHVKDGQFEISGWVATGTDRRERGTCDAAALRIDGSRSGWEAIEDLWTAGELADIGLEDHFIDGVVVAEIGEGAVGWEFDGGSCSVEFR